MIEPVGRKLIVRVIGKQEEGIGGIIIPGTANADLSEAEVVSVSKELEEKYSAGDIITFPSTAGLGQWIDKEPYLWLQEDQNEVWGIISRKPKTDSSL